MQSEKKPSKVENVESSNDMFPSEFQKNSRLYSSLPNKCYGTSRNIYKPNMPAYVSDNSNGRLEKLNDIINNRNDNFYGLSNNLSTESIRNACGFYEDELIDDINDNKDEDFIAESEAKSSSATEQTFPSNKIMEKKKTKNNNTESTSNHNSSERINRVKSTEEDDDEITSNYQQDEAMSVLNELDNILNIHETSQLNATISLESKIEDCLLELDNYLEEMDESSKVHSSTATSTTSNNNNYNNNVNSESMKHFPRIDGGPKETLSLNRSKVKAMARRKSRSQTVSNDDIELERGNLLRNTIGSRLECKTEDSRSQEMIKLFEDSNKDIETSCIVNDTNTIDSQETQSYTNASSPIEMLTQEHILRNLLFQNRSSNETNGCENRPRQFGRRAEENNRILSIRSDRTENVNNNCTIISHEQRPMSAPSPISGGDPLHAITSGGNGACIRRDERLLPSSCLFIGSEESSIHSSQNNSPISIISSSDSNSTTAAASGGNENIESSLVANEISLQQQCNTSSTDSDINSPIQLSALSSAAASRKSQWPHNLSRCLALFCCTFGLFNMCRFAVLTIHYGGNFLLQFILLSFLFGIPLFWLHMCLGYKIKAGPVSMWKISPICRGIGIALVLVQSLIAIYSSVALAWVLVYLRDSFQRNTHSVYEWQELSFLSRDNASNNSSNLTESVADYFNIFVLQRLHFVRDKENSEIRFRVSDELAFYLAVLWAVMFVILCKGVKSFGKAVFGLAILPILTFAVITCKLLFVIDFAKLQSIFLTADFDDFLVNSKTWTAAAQETFLTWALIGSSVISISSHMHVGENSNRKTFRRDAILVVFITFVGLLLAALMGFACIQILNQNSYVYVPGSFEYPDVYTAIYDLKGGSVNSDILSFPPKWVPHHSGFVGDIYRRPVHIAYRESGYQALRFITELFPAAMALASDSISWIWIALAFSMFFLLGLAQLSAMWKPISSALGNSTSAVLLSCVTGLLLSIPFTTELGISTLHYMDLLLGGSWFIPILWTSQIFGVFLIRGRPYNGDDLVNDLKMSGMMSAFMALSWNVFLPIGLITLAIVDYKISFANQFFHWRGKSYFSFWARKLAGLTQIGILLIVPVTAVVQIYRYLTNGPPDILDRIQLLYRPCEEINANRRYLDILRNRDLNTTQQTTLGSGSHTLHTTQNDAPPKYTPPPSYTTATGARLAKIFRQSIRRSVRRILRENGRLIDEERNEQRSSPSYLNVFRRAEGSNDDGRSQTISEITENAQSIPRPSRQSRQSRQTTRQRCFSLGCRISSAKQHSNNTIPEASSSCRARGFLRRNSLSQPSFTAEDVVTVLRSSHGRSQNRRNLSTQELRLMQQEEQMQQQLPDDNGITFRSIENLILNAEPPGQTPAVQSCDVHNAAAADISNDENETSVI